MSPGLDPRPPWSRRRALAAGGLGLLGAAAMTRGAAAAVEPRRLATLADRAAALPRLRTLILAQDGVALLERVFRGPGLDRPANVKSIAKSVVSALVGAAIDRGVLAGVDQPIAPLFADKLPDNPDPRLRRVTVGHLLAMRAGLERTSGPFYGRWVSSPDWVRYALARPFVDEPGGSMLYSTGSYHLLSAVLTRAAKRSTLALARDWLGEPLGIAVPPWPTDPQGIYFGGNDMLLSPRALLRFGELYRRDGTVDGRRVLPAAWVRESWTPRVRSPLTGDAYGYGWFLAEAAGRPLAYAWGYGGQMLHVVPGLGLTVVMTSDPTLPSAPDGYAGALHALVVDGVVPALLG